MMPIRSVKARRPSARNAGYHSRPRKTGMTPTYTPMSVKERSRSPVGVGVTKATGISWSMTIASAVTMRTSYGSASTQP